MSDDRDAELEALLRSRPLEPPRPDLAARIALAARALPQRRPLSLAAWVSQLFEDLQLPQPALALGALLLVGLLAGWSLELDALAGADDTDALAVQSFFYPDEEWS